MSHDEPRHNLPARLTSFVGRERELTEVARLLGGARIVTLVGAPGVGKTRLALQAADALRLHFADGVWFVELAAFAEPAVVASAVAATLGVHEDPRRPLLTTLADHLGERHALLILDNCEHLVAACAALAETLLRATLRLRVLATSREALRIDGETTWRVPSLSTPEAVPERGGQPPADGARAADLARYEAVQLFVHRASSVLPAFRLTDRQAGAVARIRRRLDGIPLAIELATARLDGLSVEQVAARLDDHFALLTVGRRTALPRQQTLRGAVDWSYDLLPDRERLLLRRLAVFAGGWTLAAAEAVCGEQGLEPLLGLVGRSLVVAEERDGEVRYRLLEMIRQYGWERLAGTDELATLRDRHRAWLQALAEQADPELRYDGRSVAWLDRLEVEHDNVRAALAWCEQDPDGIEAGLRLAGALWTFWWLRGHFGEGRRWLDRMIARVRSDPAHNHSPAFARVLNGAAQLTSYSGDFRSALSLAEEALSIWRECGDRRMIAWALSRVGHYRGRLRPPEDGLAPSEESVAMCRGLSDERLLMGVLVPFGALLLRLGEHRRAMAVGEEGLALCRRYGHSLFALHTLNNIGKAAITLGDYDRADAPSAEALAVARELGHPRGIADTARYRGVLMHARGDGVRAAELFRESLALSHEQADRWSVAETLEWLAALACHEGLRDRAARLFAAAEAIRDSLGVAINRSEADHDRDIATVRASLGGAAFAEDWAAGADLSREQAVEEALDLARSIADGVTRGPGLPRRSAPTRVRGPADERPSPLTPREREVATLIARGLTNRQIASELVISERTASVHVYRILRKLGVSSRTLVAGWVMAEGLVPRPSR